MAVEARFQPTAIEYWAVMPGDVGPDAGRGPSGVQAIAPTDATVTATIVGDTVRFNVTGIATSRRWTRPPTRLEIEELPPLPPEIRENARRARIVEHLPIASSDGSPLAVTRGDDLAVAVRYDATVLEAGRDVYVAELRITADEWEPVTIPLVLLVAQVRTTLAADRIVLHQGAPYYLGFTVRSLVGPATTVSLFPSWSLSATVNLPTMAATAVHVPRGGEISGQIVIHADAYATLGHVGGLDVMQVAFDGKQVNFLPLEAIVEPGEIRLSLPNGPFAQAKQGERLSFHVRAECAGAGTTVSFTPVGVLPAGVLPSSLTFDASSASTSMRDVSFDVDGTAPLVTNHPLECAGRPLVDGRAARCTCRSAFCLALASRLGASSRRNMASDSRTPGTSPTPTAAPSASAWNARFRVSSVCRSR
jgi:hypothetical protein